MRTEQESKDSVGKFLSEADGMAALSPGVKPLVTDIQSYHRVKEDLEDAIRAVCLYQPLLDTEMVEKLKGVVGRSTGNVTFDVNEVDRQYHLLLSIQKQVVAPDSLILMGAGVKEIGTMVSSISSALSLFMKSKKEISAMREEAKLKEAVLTAIKGLDPEAQAKFFEVMDGE